MEADVDAKLVAVDELHDAWQEGSISWDRDRPVVQVDTPGRPALPVLVHPLRVERRRLGSQAGQGALVHAIAHIEFNAINLALDAVYRFRELPDAYYGDWLRVAHEEAYHFRLLRERLSDLGYAYGHFNAHNGLWEMAVKTADDALVRMALVPRILEARGLDVTPGIQAKLRQAGDGKTAAILDIILRDEIGHVLVGNRWYHFLCAQRGLEPVPTFIELYREYGAPRLHHELNWEARGAAGFSEEEMSMLRSLSMDK